MTAHQKSFAQFTQDFCELCERHHGVKLPTTEAEGWTVYEFQTRLGRLRATIMKSDYESQKRGLVSIYMKFGHEVDAGAIERELFGDFNHFSGKWNIHLSDKLKINLEPLRAQTLKELAVRLMHVEKGNVEIL